MNNKKSTKRVNNEEQNKNTKNYCCNCLHFKEHPGFCVLENKYKARKLNLCKKFKVTNLH